MSISFENKGVITTVAEALRQIADSIDAGHYNNAELNFTWASEQLEPIEVNGQK